MSEAPTPDAGPLSVDQAVAALMPEPVEDAAPEAPVEAADEPEIEAEASPAEETEGEAETPPEEEEAEAEPEAVAPAEPPKYWSQDAKAKFAELPPELQAVVLQQEGPREEAAAKVKAEAAAERQAAQAEVAKVTQLAEHLSGFLPQAIEAFQNRWGAAPDWKAYADQFGAEAMILAKVEHEEHLALLQQTAQATEAAQAQAREATIKAEFAILAEIDPELADPAKGQERRAEVTKYLMADGFAPEVLKDISAREMRLARKAMLWDQAQAALKARPTPKPAPAPAVRAPVRPAAAPAQSSSRSALQQAQSRFNLDPSPDNATALLLAQRA
jgi:hypothetical protein